MGEVVSIADTAARLAPLGAEVLATEGPRGSFAGAPPAAMRFAGEEGDEVKIFYRDIEGRPATIAVLYGATTLKVIQALCRRLARSPDRLIATNAAHIKDPFGGEPDPFGLAYIHDAGGERGSTPGEALAFVKGVSWVTLNVVLKKPTPAPRFRLAEAETPAVAASDELAPEPDMETLSGDDE
jgi:hypothetical protein